MEVIFTTFKGWDLKWPCNFNCGWPGFWFQVDAELCSSIGLLSLSGKRVGLLRQQQEKDVLSKTSWDRIIVKDIMESNHITWDSNWCVCLCGITFNLADIRYLWWGIFIHSLIGVSCLLDISSRHWPWWCGAHKNIDKEANQLKFMKREKIQKNRCVWSTKYSWSFLVLNK